MADPLRALAAPVEPVSPDSRFATRLRARIERALDDPQGDPMSGAATPVGVVPYLAVSNGREALTWYADALGAVEFGERYEEPGGRIGHAGLRVHDAVFYLSDAAPDIGVVPGDPLRPVATSLVLTVPDTDASLQRARDAGARVEREPQDNPYGRMAVIRDPYGHRWMLEGPVVSPAYGGIRHGDVGYVALWTPDVQRAERFYAQVLGWEYAAGSSDQGRQVTNTTLPTGLWGGQQTSTLFCCYAVDDVAAAVAAVREGGGSADEPTQEPYGRSAMCTDPEGVSFTVYEPAGDQPRPSLNGAGNGDLSYITHEVGDQARARAFYGRLLGPAYGEGRDEGSWTDDDPRPMWGMPGGLDGTRVPMWRVDDIVDAVARVRAAGGDSTEPLQRPYGLMAECTDDQGGRFYLGQL